MGVLSDRRNELCIGDNDPETGLYIKRKPYQYELDAELQEEADILASQPTIEQELQEKRQMTVCSPWQFKKALTRSGAKRNQVNLFVNNPNTGDPTIDQDIIDGWASATEYRRIDSTVLYIQGILGWTDLEVDTLFELAVTL